MLRTTIPVLICAILFLSCNNTPLPFAGGDGNFNDDWEFIKDPDYPISPELFRETGQPAWQKITLPHTANIEPVESSRTQWQGTAFYRKFFTVPKEYEGKALSLKFGAAMQDAKIYLNEKLLLTHAGGYLPFTVKLDAQINYGKRNCILIELNNRDNAKIPPGKPLAKLDFNYYSGLYRNATLEIKDKLHISDAIEADRVAGGGIMVSFSDVSEQRAKIKVKVDVTNESKTAKDASLTITLTDPNGQTIAVDCGSAQVAALGFYQFEKEIVLEKPRLWSPDTPELYTLKAKLSNNGLKADSLTEHFGIRTFSFVKQGILLNGKQIRLRGTNRHQEYPYVGYALSDNAQYRDAYKIKQAGFNFVRCSHYPQSPAFLSACDQLGILVMDAIPGWQFIGEEEFQLNCLRDTRQMIRRDRNHPSVILWEASLNETVMPVSFMESLHQAVHEELPVNDVYTCGWMDEAYDVFIPARQHAKPPEYWNNYAKNKPILIAEYGDWEYYAQNAGFNQTAFGDLQAEERNSRQLRGFGQKRMAQQALNYQESHNDNLKGPVAGDANWLLFDYKRGYAPDIESSGIMDLFRLPKFAFYFYASQTESREPMIFLANYWNDPKFKEVKVYSNCEEVQLSLNGEIIAKKKPDNDRNSTNLLHPPFSFSVPEYIPGKLEAKGFNSGKEVVKTEVNTPGSAAKIVLSVDLSGKQLEAGMNDLVFVYASVTDANGVVIPDDNRPINFSVEGDAELIGDNPRKAEAGISTILLRAGRKAGIINLRATSKDLAEGKLDVEPN